MLDNPTDDEQIVVTGSKREDQSRVRATNLW